MKKCCTSSKLQKMRNVFGTFSKYFFWKSDDDLKQKILKSSIFADLKKYFEKVPNILNSNFIFLTYTAFL